MKTAKKIAVTGGIGSGKTYALNVLKMAGYKVISCDEIINELYQKRKVKLLLKKMFPSAVSGKFNIQIDRKEIAKIVFNNKDKLEELTNTTTPLVFKEITRISKKIKGILFVEVPLLFEQNCADMFDGVLIIKRPLKDRIESVKIRSKMTEEEVLERIKNQVDYDSIDLSPYKVIENDLSLEFKQNLLNLAQTF